MAPNLCILFLLVIPLMPFSNGYRGREFKICSSPPSCGRVKGIEYPFSLENNRYCGGSSPLFQLSCRNASSAYPIFFTKFNMHSINTSGRTIVFDPSIDKLICSGLGNPGQNYTQIISNDLKNFFKLGANVSSLTLFSDCQNRSTIPRFHTVSFLCPNLGGNLPMYYLNKWAIVGTKCKNNVTLVVSKRALNEFKQSNGKGRTLESVLKEVIEFQYMIPNSELCLPCQHSGGVCGSRATAPSDFVCYQPDADKPTHLSLILGSASTAVVVILILIIAFWLRKRKGKATSNHQNIEAYLKMHGPLAPRRYTYASIRKMTNSFKEKLGEGGYAVVYKGTLTDGQLVAVKLLKQSKGTTAEEFLNEVASMGRTNHINVLTLLGFCFERTHKALVFEFMANGSLDKFTHNGDDLDQPLLPWNTVFNIALGIARGLEYLHRGCNTRIVHFDIKPHNILLDEEFCPKISDFGLARLCPQKESTISMLEARGTIGYIAPEVFCRTFGGVSHKSDVYSYGMMVLDLVCGRRNSYTYSDGVYASNESCFTQWIYEKVELWDEVEVDGAMSEEERERQRKMLLVSLWCVQTYPSNRPSISKAVEMLEGSIQLIQMPPKPVLCSYPSLASAIDSSASL